MREEFERDLERARLKQEAGEDMEDADEEEEKYLKEPDQE
jgi:hypothetical protein